MTGPAETTPNDVPSYRNQGTWKRGAFMLFFIIAIGIAQAIINLTAIVQFLSLLITGSRNEPLAKFGTALGAWLEQAAAFQACASDEKPYPFGGWPA